jgi:iron complex transport system substrate-binding protein
VGRFIGIIVAAFLVVVSCKGKEDAKPLQKIHKIISIGAANTEVLVALGAGDKIIAADEFSNGIEGIKPDIPMFSMMNPDGEQIVNMQPDVIFVTGISKAGGADPLRVVEEAGIRIIYIPSSISIYNIKEDIRLIASAMGAEPKGDSIILHMEKEIEAIKQIGDTITNKKSVYFELAAAPYMYTFGTGTYLNEMLELIGAKNIFASQKNWISIAGEAVLNASPDVILTSVNYIENPALEIKSRPGWGEIAAVRNNAVYYISSDASNRPNHNIVKALKEMAKAVYPDKY